MPRTGKLRNKLGPALMLSALALVTLTAIIVGAWEHDSYPSDDVFLKSVPNLPARIDPVALSGLRSGEFWLQRLDDPQGVMNVESRVVLAQKVPKGELDLVETLINDRPAGGRLYRVGPDGLGLIALTGPETTYLEPPLPLFRSPLFPDLVTSWQGKFRTGSTTTSATAVMRFDGPETLHTRAGKAFPCYRLDLLLLTNPGGQRKADRQVRPQHTILWFSPGVGIVRQREELDDKISNSDLVRYGQVEVKKPVDRTGSKSRG
jgi:hypothetical protein